jgi:hypothetical protein
VGLVALQGGVTRPAIGCSKESVHFGVVLPIHDEEELALAALDSIDRAIAAVSHDFVTTGIAIVLDACSDRSSGLVAEWRHRSLHRDANRFVEIVTTNVANVGHSRKLGCAALLRAWAGIPPAAIWLASTDADSEVPRDWISGQLSVRREGGQVWVGPVSVHDWSGRSAGTAEAWRRQYENECRPIHGANFGINAATYLDAGGFAEMPTGEDRDLYERTVTLGAVIRHDPQLRVVTSSRRRARAPEGFAHALSSIEAAVVGPTSADPIDLTAS